MSQPGPQNLAASVRQRLLNLSRERGEDPNLVLARYGMERLLYRLSISPHAESFILKGALLFAVWTGQMHRPTRDLDMLGYGDNSEDALAALFRELCVSDAPADGLRFDPDAVRVSEIREDQEYGGNRVRVLARLGNARIQLHVDVGAGDAVVPAPQSVIYPVLLQGSPAPRLRAYPKETVVAEKLHAMTVLGKANSRMKDFYDLWVMARQFSFEGPLLVRAVTATFDRRSTPTPATEPVALTSDFALDPNKQVQWQAFLNRSRLDANGPHLEQVVGELRAFLIPVLGAVHRTDFDQCWHPDGPWR